MPPELWEALLTKPAEDRARFVRVWQLLGYVEEESPAVPDTETALAEIDLDDTRIKQQPAPGSTRRKTAPDRTPRGAPHRRYRWPAVTGVIIALILVAGAWYWSAPVHITAGSGQQIEATLPDGSIVELNSGSHIEYFRGFEYLPWMSRPVRSVSLEGEAYFDIQPSERPFIVESFNARVRVLGTAFNVRARSNSATPETVITLSHGRVGVSAIEDPAVETTLDQEGDMIRIVDRENEVGIERRQEQQLDRVLAWRSQGFVVENIPLVEAIKEMERRYAIDVQLESSIASTESMTMFFPERPTAEEIIQSICLSISCNYRQTSEGFVIF